MADLFTLSFKTGYFPSVLKIAKVIPIFKKDFKLDYSNYCPKKTLTLWPLFMDGVQLPQGYSHFEETVYFLPLSSQKFLSPCHQILRKYLKNLCIGDYIPFLITKILSMTYSLDSDNNILHLTP